MADYFPSLYTPRSNSPVHSDFPNLVRLGTGLTFDYQPHSRCATCSKAKITHAVKGRSWYTGDLAAAERIDNAEPRRMQHDAHYLNWIAHGVYADTVDASKIRAQDGNSWVSTFNFPILAASGHTLTLDATTLDPRALTLYTYSYPNPSPPPTNLSFPVTGCIAPNDTVEFRDDSVLAGRVEAKIVGIDFSALDASQAEFDIELDQECSFAMTPTTPGGTTFTARVKAHRYAPELWQEIIDHYDPGWARLQRQWTAAQFPVGNIFTLTNSVSANCRVAQLKQGMVNFEATIRAEKQVAGVWSDITISAANLIIAQTGSATGAGSWVSTLDLDGLITGASAVRITYYAEVISGGGLKVCEGKCHWDKPDWAGVLGIKQEGSPLTRGAGPRGAFYCHRRGGWSGHGDGPPYVDPPSGLAQYVPGNCYRTTDDCDGFELNIPSTEYLSTFLRDIWHSQSSKRLQDTPGDAVYWTLYRIKHPSLDSLAEMYGIAPPVTWFQQVLFEENGGYGQLKTLGGAFDEWVTGGPFQIGGVGNGVDWAGGIAGAIFLTTNPPNEGLWERIAIFGTREWESLSDGLGDAVDATTDPYFDRYFQKRKPQCTQNYTGEIAALPEGEGHAQSFPTRENLIIGNLDIASLVAVDKQDLLWEAGAWTVEGIACSRRLTVRALDNWTNSSRVKVQGTVYEATDPSPGSNVILVACELAGDHCASKLVSGGGADETPTLYDAGGNIVEAPAWARSQNYYEADSYRKWGPQGGKAVTGDVVYFTGAGVPAALVGLGFYVRSVAPQSGAADAGATPPMSGCPGMPPGYDDFWNKRDVVALWDDNGLLAANLAGLAAVTFDVKTDGVLYPVAADPTKGAIVLSHDTFNTGATDFVDITAANWICPNRAAGIVYLKTSYVAGLAASPNHCFELAVCRANRLNQIGEHHVNQVGQALEVLDSFQVTPGNLGLKEIGAWQGLEAIELADYPGFPEPGGSCGDPNIKGTIAPGQRARGAIITPVTGANFYHWDSYEMPGVEDVGYQNIMGLHTGEDQSPAQVNLFAYIKLSSSFTFKETALRHLPENTSVTARAVSSLEDFQIVNWRWYHNDQYCPPGSSASAGYVHESEANEADMITILVGEKNDGTFEILGGGDTIHIVSDTPQMVDFTWLVTRLLATKDSEYVEIFLALFPPVADVIGLQNGTANWQTLLDSGTLDEYGLYGYLSTLKSWYEVHAEATGSFVRWNGTTLTDFTIEGMQLPVSGYSTMAREVYAQGNPPRMD